MLKDVLRQLAPVQVVPVDLSSGVALDLTDANRELASVDLSDPEAFTAYVEKTARRQGKQYGIGGYGEDRCIYRMSRLFSAEEEPRSIHLGVDIWVPPGTPVLAAHDAQVHSTGDNPQFGDYGPTVILVHHSSGETWHTLYGHLSRSSLKNLAVGTEVLRGGVIGWVGQPHENGGWPSHLHFQIIRDMGDYVGDYPGVCKPGEQEYYLQNCPDPNLLLGTGHRPH